MSWSQNDIVMVYGYFNNVCDTGTDMIWSLLKTAYDEKNKPGEN